MDDETFVDNKANIFYVLYPYSVFILQISNMLVSMFNKGNH
jgi:hypothetical protein